MKCLEEKSLRNGKFEDFYTAMDLSNRTKNRYANVLPRMQNIFFFQELLQGTFLFIHILAEKTRVKLREKEGETSDYINANYIGVHIFY